ncbi:hypothetical protein AAVH_15221 [Aphelenchoides avenae]|nr:hypothetical protein AAVH_15221 [Aphelenchus avenae]
MSGILRLFGKRKRSRKLSESSEDDALTIESLSLADDAEPAANVTSSDEEAPSSSNNNVEVRDFPEPSYVRWLTRGKLACAIHEMWPAIEYYFGSTDECDATLRGIFHDESGKKPLVFKTLTTFMVYILGQLDAYNETAMSLSELVTETKNFEADLEALIAMEHYGADVEPLLEQLEADGFRTKRNLLQREFKQFYKNTLDYWKKWFGYLEDFKMIAWLGLDHDSLDYKGAIVPSFKKFISTDTRSVNALFTEVREIRSTLQKLQHKDEYKKLNVIGKWMVILKNANLIEMRKLVGALLTVFASNAYCESVFSIAKRLWTPEKSNLHVDTLRALLAIKCNSDVECTDMHDIFCADRDLLKTARTVAKYSA